MAGADYRPIGEASHDDDLWKLFEKYSGGSAREADKEEQLISRHGLFKFAYDCKLLANQVTPASLSLAWEQLFGTKDALAFDEFKKMLERIAMAESDSRRALDAMARHKFLTRLVRHATAAPLDEVARPFLEPGIVGVLVMYDDILRRWRSMRTDMRTDPRDAAPC